MEIKVKVYNGNKYDVASIVVAEVEYQGVKLAKVVSISDEEIYAMGFDEVDPNGEYFILEHDNGETSTFKNSMIDAFKM